MHESYEIDEIVIMQIPKSLEKVVHVLIANMESADKNARAFGWEVGNGTPISRVIESSDDNPFLNPNWRDSL